ncbi:unnamed protein product [Coffea canephora]|uniref:DH200=94 genomic scaffold, scaffold_705 n=1 Tax=Coffea canephora TaxID=49390 RepID=A0A068VGX8_COFCA|nr:unnamed protein product [Coffea canephora]
MLLGSGTLGLHSTLKCQPKNSIHISCRYSSRREIGTHSHNPIPRGYGSFLATIQEVEKEIFLDIACFFKGKKKDHIRRVLDSFNFYPDIGIKALIDKSLVTISGGRILMHCLIQDTGKAYCSPKGSRRARKTQQAMGSRGNL